MQFYKAKRRAFPLLITIGLLTSSLYLTGVHIYPTTADGGWWDAGWHYRELITLNHTKVEATLSDFPVMVDLEASNFDFNKCRLNLEDIRFTDYNGNPLQYELENTRNSSGYRYWTRVPIDSNVVYTDGAHNIVPYDIDVDGNLELVTCSYRADSLQFYKYYGDPTASSNWVRYVIDANVGGGTGGSGAHYIAIADINGDGRMDLVVAEDQQQEDVVAYLAPVDRLNMSAWQKHVLFDDDTLGVYHCEVGDIDGDGDADISMATRSAGKVGWLENTGALDNWPATWIDESARDPFNARIADLDHDGKGEIVSTYASTSTTDGYYVWYDFSGDPRNPANWVEHTMANVGTGSVIGPCTMQIVDMDGDGNLDVVGYNYDQYDIFIFENPYPANMMSEWPKYKVSDQYFSRDSGIGDVDGDGDLDIVGSDQDKNSIFWLENPGNPFTLNWKDHVIDTSSSYLDWAHCAAVGDIDKDGDLDVAAAAANGNTFQWYVNNWYEPQKQAVVWVKLPSISNVSDTAFYMYYGNPSATDDQNPTAVWDNGYKLVQHLEETSATHYDSTSNNNDGVPINGITQGVTGKIDGADDFDGNSGYVDCGTSSSLEFGSGQDFTITAWIKADTFADPVNTKFIFHRRNGEDLHFYQLEVHSDNKLVFNMWSGSQASSCTITSSETLNVGQWYFVCVSVDRDVTDGAKMFVNLNHYDGDPRPASDSLGTGGHFVVGRSSWGGGCAYFDGVIDEARVSNVARNLSDIRATYNNQYDPSTFYTIAAEEAIGTKLCIDPSLVEKSPLDVGTRFKINVTVENIADMWGFDFNITWDNSLITLVAHEYNDTLDAIWGHDNWFVGSNENGSGYYELAAVSLLNGFGSTAATPLLTLEFRVESFFSEPKETLVHFMIDKLSDSHWKPIVHTVNDGTYRITGGKPMLEMSPSVRICSRYDETFMITINVSDVINVEDFEFEVHYNATILEAMNVSWGIWGSGDAILDNVNGKITGCTSGSSVEGNATLANITFRAAAHHIWKDERSVAGWRNNLTDTIFFQWANLSYTSKPDLGYVRGGLNEINVGPDVAYEFVPIQGDVDNNGIVEITDLRTVAAFYACKEGDPLWPAASAYDLRGDRVIDVFDIVIIARNYGYTYAP